jgi:hypothetical protein
MDISHRCFINADEWDRDERIIIIEGESDSSRISISENGFRFLADHP